VCALAFIVFTGVAFAVVLALTDLATRRAWWGILLPLLFLNRKLQTEN